MICVYSPQMWTSTSTHILYRRITILRQHTALQSDLLLEIWKVENPEFKDYFDKNIDFLVRAPCWKRSTSCLIVMV